MTYVGVLIAVYGLDDPTLFRRAIQSVLDQSTPAGISVRVYLGVDGPLSDTLEQVIREHEQQLFLVSRSESNIGLARTLNRLISQRGAEPFFFRMDADDVSLPGRFLAQLSHMAEHPQIDILGTAIVEEQTHSGARRVVQFARDPEDARKCIARRVPVAHPTVCLRARVLDTVQAYPTSRGNEDIAMWFECMQAGFTFDNLPAPLLLFTLGPSFWKRRSFDKAFSEFRCYIRGIYELEGLTWHYVYPLARLLIRLSPTAVSKWFYGSRLRRLSTST
jgi:glycosyltransferase involved in cell wall biosynthesis